METDLNFSRSSLSAMRSFDEVLPTDAVDDVKAEMRYFFRGAGTRVEGKKSCRPSGSVCSSTVPRQRVEIRGRIYGSVFLSSVEGITVSHHIVRPKTLLRLHQ